MRKNYILFVVSIGALSAVLMLFLMPDVNKLAARNDFTDTRLVTQATSTISTSTPQTATTSTSTNSSAVSTATTTQQKKSTPTKTAVLESKKKASLAEEKPNPTPTSATSTKNPPGTVSRLENPYPFNPIGFDTVNLNARRALVNILCMSDGALRPITGSGVIVSPKGVILTNAHVAQYVLLTQSPAINLTCTARTGSPAENAWKVEVLYIPPEWVREHAQDVLNAHALGTGEHDYALLHIVGPATTAPLPNPIPSMPVETRQGVAFQGDEVYVASYPAEFIGGITAQNSLYAQSSVTTIQQLLTFEEGTLDAFSLGGVILAQGGSSGGMVVNEWGRLVGVITTTTEGTTTATRNLRAISTSYVDRDIKTLWGKDLATILAGDIQSQAEDFAVHTAPELLGLFLKQLRR